MRGFAIVFLGLAGIILAAAARADDLTGADRFLCSAGPASACCDDGQCASGTAAELNIPQFIEVDVANKRLSTTKASGLNRTSPIDNLKRVNGQVVMQGVENERAYSIVISDSTGEMSAAVAASGCNVTVFGACTPLPASK